MLNRKNRESDDELRTNHERVLVVIGAIIFGVLMFCATYFEWLAYPEQLTQDMMYKSDEALNNDIKIIAIDDKTIQELGDYNQWSRQVYADLVNTLCDGDSMPSVIGFDVLFFSEKDDDADTAFAEACEKTDNVVVASQLNVDKKNPIVMENQDVKLYWPGGVMLPYIELNNVVDTGFVDIILDNDGMVRHSLLKVGTDTGVAESFAMTVSRKYCQKVGIEFIEPQTDKTGSILIHYVAGTGSYEYISLCDVLDGTVPASVFDDAIVLIGSYSEGMMDSYNVPVDRRSRMYGVEINANIVQSILLGQQIFRPSLLLVAIINGVISALLLFVTNKKKISILSIVLLVALVIHFAFCFAAYATGILWYITYMILGLILTYIINLIWKYTYERRERERDTKLLLYSMAEAMTEAIDQRTPYNASHTRNISKYSVDLARYVNAQHKKKRTKLRLSGNEINQLKLAALLHDVGKMSVPIEVLDKPSRLGEHKEDILARFEKIELLYRLDMAEGTKPGDMVLEELEELEQIRRFVLEMDKKEFLKEEDKTQVEAVAKKEYTYENGEKISYFTDEEIECMLIPKGTLTHDEMELVHHHAVYTDEILERIRFGKNYDKVRNIAASHHEFINGKGYPKQLKGDEIDIATRILTICDVYDALIADDRPYKKAKTKEQAFKILGFMAKDGEIDGEILEFARELWND